MSINQDPQAAGKTPDTLEHIAVIEIVEPKKTYPIGIETDLIIQVRCPEHCNLSGGILLIGDESDQIIAEQYLTCFDKEHGVNTTGAFPVQIPTEPGTYTWTVAFFPKGDGSADDEDASTSEDGAAAGGARESVSAGTGIAAAVTHAAVQAEFCFTANKHVTGMTVHREYQPVEIGKNYVITVGVECLTGCSLLGQKVEVFCQDELLATAELQEPVGISPKLYRAEITLTAPDTLGLYELRCCVKPEGLGLAHTANECLHYLTTGLASQCRIAITAVDAESLKPLADVSLTSRPAGGYPSLCCTDSAGRASIDAPWGEITLTASCENYEYAKEKVTLPEGQTAVEFTLPMEYHAPLFM
ncbi:MAG: hypothetical protein LBU48_00185 [Coriobacteriales bacterium]|jgi:hypothetical protein|nr:hypothetical protein [Coriobacteriales bacterium]